MPTVRPCRRGCSSTRHYTCRHRFGERIWVLSEPARLSFTRMSDLQVVLDFLYTIHRRWADHRGKKRFVIVTHDENFVDDARAQHRNQKNMQSLPLTWGPDWVEYRDSKHPTRIRVCRIASEHHDHDRDLWSVIELARLLRRVSV
jgi:hypothetical protein